MLVSLNVGQFADQPVVTLPSIAQGLGYSYIELSPRADFVPLFGHPRCGPETVSRLRESLVHAGVGVSAVYGLFRWTATEERERQAAVDYLRRTIQVAAELECGVVSCEFGESSKTPLASEASFWRSISEILPSLEREGVELRIEPHPGDFVESSDQAVDMIRNIDSDRVSYLYCVPHTFCLGGKLGDMIRYAGGALTHVHVADVFALSRYILNPPDASVQVHQHLDIGMGEINWDEFVEALVAIEFDGVLAACSAGWPERAEESARGMREAIGGLVQKITERRAKSMGSAHPPPESSTGPRATK